MEYKEDEFLMLSGIQHFSFCPRQWALIHIEQQWQENLRTVEGNLLHEKAHNGFLAEKRGNHIISRALPIHSFQLGISGECDVVEFHKSKEGTPIYGQAETYKLVPVEYKKGKPKETQEDELQLVAQAICLEEMFCCNIEQGYLYYGEKRKRTTVLIDEELRRKVMDLCNVMHEYYRRKHTPRVKWKKACNACSLKEICVPILGKEMSAKEYINKNI